MNPLPILLGLLYLLDPVRPIITGTVKAVTQVTRSATSIEAPLTIEREPVAIDATTLAPIDSGPVVPAAGSIPPAPAGATPDTHVPARAE